MGAPGEIFALARSGSAAARPFCWAVFSLVTLCAATPEAAAPRRRRGGAARPPKRHSRITGRLLLLGGVRRRPLCGVRRRMGRLRSGSALYVQRVVSDAALYVKLSRPCVEISIAVFALSGILLRVAHASGAQDDPSGPLVRGEASVAVPFWCFWVALVPRGLGNLDPPPIGP